MVLRAIRKKNASMILQAKANKEEACCSFRRKYRCLVGKDFHRGSYQEYRTDLTYVNIANYRWKRL